MNSLSIEKREEIRRDIETICQQEEPYGESFDFFCALQEPERKQFDRPKNAKINETEWPETDEINLDVMNEREYYFYELFRYWKTKFLNLNHEYFSILYSLRNVNPDLTGSSFKNNDSIQETFERILTQSIEWAKQQKIDNLVSSMAPTIEKTAQDVAEMKPRVKGVLAQQNSDKMKDKHSITQAEAVDILKNSNNPITERTLRNWINGKGTPKNFPAWPTDAVTFRQFAVTLDYKQKTKNALTQRRSRQ